MSESIAIDHIQTSHELERCPFPIPYGWYVIELSENLAVGDVRSVQAFNQEWVMFRGEDSSVGVADPYCPHLGAHLGHGGQVVGNNLRCPFHHWQFDNEGWCKEVPYGKVMPGLCRKKAVLRSLPTEERYGMIWVWYHPKAEPPGFDIPDVPELEAEGYVPVRRGQWDIGTCLQEMGENSVDVAHLKFLHGAPMVPPVEAHYEGHKFNFNIAGGYITGEHHGAGTQIIHHNKDGVSMLMFSTPLPLTSELSRVRMNFTFKDYPQGSKEREIAEHLYQHSIGEAEGEDSAGFESVDLVVWNNKKYRPNPLLCDGDGPILTWRKYHQQFYVE